MTATVLSCRRPHLRLKTGRPSAGSLLTAPQNISNGYIRRVYPSFIVQNGDRLQAIVNSLRGGATQSGVLFRIDYQLADGISATSGRSANNTTGNISSLISICVCSRGRMFSLSLQSFSLGNASGDRALWVEPRIVRNTITLTPTP